MSLDGYQDLDIVLEVLRFHSVSIKEDGENPGALELRRGPVVESKHFERLVPKSILWGLSRAFGIKMYEFDKPPRKA